MGNNPTGERWTYPCKILKNVYGTYLSIGWNGSKQWKITRVKC